MAPIGIKLCRVEMFHLRRFKTEVPQASSHICRRLCVDHLRADRRRRVETTTIAECRDLPEALREETTTVAECRAPLQEAHLPGETTTIAECRDPLHEAHLPEETTTTVACRDPALWIRADRRPL